MRAVPITERFLQKFVPEPNTGCWLWTASINNSGYGQILEKRKAKLAHRISWVLHNGPIPFGMHVLHKCDTRPCVNPSHLFLGTNSDNVRDRVKKNRTFNGQSAKTHCPKGHEYTEENTHIYKTKRGGLGIQRKCRQCQSERKQDWRKYYKFKKKKYG